MQKTITPVDGSVYAERPYATPAQISAALKTAAQAQTGWKHTPLAERAALLTRFTDAFVARRDAIAAEISWQMGRPLAFAPGEVRGFEERARYMIDIAPHALADVQAMTKPGLPGLSGANRWA
jgi:acyl-CoA reductase-like NAD-dependent aldehyde dehydrogenase